MKHYKTLPVVTGVSVIKPFTLVVLFKDGVCRRIDLTNKLWGPVFEPLKNPEYFAKAFVDDELGTVAWPNGADLAPEFLYESGEDAE